MGRKQLEKIFCWKISGELKLFKYRTLKMKKEEIFQAAYRIDSVICIYELLIEMSSRMGESELKAGIAFPDILLSLYDRWLGYEDAHMEEIQYCLDKELEKIFDDYREKNPGEKGSAA